MTCQEFLDRYSEYLDECMDRGEAALWRCHLAACASCARYDRVVRQGARVFRDLPQIEPSIEFRSRLQQRIFRIHDEVGTAARAYGPGTAVTLAVAAALALLAWAPAFRVDSPRPAAHAAATASPPQPSDPATEPRFTPPPSALADASSPGESAGLGGANLASGGDAVSALRPLEEPAWEEPEPASPRLRLVPVSAARPLGVWVEPRYSPLVVQSPAYRLVGSGAAAGEATPWDASARPPPARLGVSAPIIIE